MRSVWRRNLYTYSVVVGWWLCSTTTTTTTTPWCLGPAGCADAVYGATCRRARGSSRWQGRLRWARGRRAGGRGARGRRGAWPQRRGASVWAGEQCLLPARPAAQVDHLLGKGRSEWVVVIPVIPAWASNTPVQGEGERPCKYGVPVPRYKAGPHFAQLLNFPRLHGGSAIGFRIPEYTELGLRNHSNTL